GISPTFHADTISRRESGLRLMSAIRLAIWSMRVPSGAGHDRHWTPYTGPSSPSASAHSFQIVTPRSLRYRTLDSPRRNHKSSTITDFTWTRLVVTSGKRRA